MARSNKTLRQRLLLPSITLAVLCVLGYLGYRVYERGLEREGMYERAERALRDQNYVEAIRFLRETLLAEPGHRRARELLLFALEHEGQIDELQDLAEKWGAEGGENGAAMRTLCQLAVRRGDYAEADRIARSLAESQPDFSYQVLSLLQDLSGIAKGEPRLRLEAAATMRGLASVTQSEAAKAEALVFAAAVTLEVIPEGAGRTPRMMERLRQDLRSAVDAATQARQRDGTYPYELTMARIRILAEKDEESLLASQTLRRYIHGLARSEHAVADLAMYHIRRAEWGEAVDLMRELKDGYLWQRVYLLLSRTAPRQVALDVLDAGADRSRPERRLARADVLLRSEDATEREEGRAILRSFFEDPGTDVAHVLAALQLLALRADIATARAAASEAHLVDRGNMRLNAFLASLLSSSEQDKEEALLLAERLASATDSEAESQEMMRLLGGQGVAFERYIESQVAKGGEGAMMHRLSRALGLLAGNRGKPETEQGAEVRAKVEQDLRMLLEDMSAKKPSLVLAFQLAALIGSREMAGALLGRAVAMPGAPADLGIRVLESVDQVQNREAIEGIAKGAAGVAARSPSPAFVSAFARALALAGPSRDGIPALLEEAAAEPASRPPALSLASQIAFVRGDLDTAARIAGVQLAEDPGQAGARDIVAAKMLRDKRFEEVLALYQGIEGKTADGYARVVGALVLLDRKPEALEIAREARNAHPRVPLPYAQLAQLYIDLGRPREALAVLSITPSNNAYLLHLRADLLLQNGDYGLAGQIFESLLVVSAFRDRNAWAGLYETLVKQEKLEEFQSFAARVLAADFLKQYRGERAHVHVLRGMSFESAGKLHEALSDYESAVAANGNAWEALNNAAWHISQLAPARVDVAKGYVDRALTLRPGDAVILDTAAEVYAVTGDFARALGFMDEALAKVADDRRAKYMLHKAMLLRAAGQEDAMRLLLKDLAAGHPDAIQGKRAKEMLWEIAERERRAEEANREAAPPAEDRDE